MSDPHIRQVVWTDELIRRFWDGFSHTHLENLSFGKLAGPKFIEFIRDYLPAGAEICDYGAGSGHLAELLIKAGFATAIYEPSPGRAAALRRRLSGYDRFLGVVGSEDRRKFDLVIMAEVIEHLPGQVLNQTLERIRGLLRGRGTLIVTTPNDENLSEAQVFCPVCQQTFHPWQHVRSFTHKSLENQLNEYGFVGRFIGLVDFSNYAPAIDQSRLFPPFFEFMMVLGNELREFVRRLPADDLYSTESGGAAGSIYTTDVPQFDHRLIFLKIAKLRAQATAQIREITWPSLEQALPSALTQLCDEFYSQLRSAIDVQLRRAQIRELQARSDMNLQKLQMDIQQQKKMTSELVDRFRAIGRAVSGMGISSQLRKQGLNSLNLPRSRFYWAARFFWEFLRDPALLAEVVATPGSLADHIQAMNAVGRVSEPEVGVEIERTTPAIDKVFGTTEAVRVHLSSIGERVQQALATFTVLQSNRRAELGYDAFIGRGSSILYIGEKIDQVL